MEFLVILGPVAARISRTKNVIYTVLASFPEYNLHFYNAYDFYYSTVQCIANGGVHLSWAFPSCTTDLQEIMPAHTQTLLLCDFFSLMEASLFTVHSPTVVSELC